jgi:DME family drug/metabolite transporter
MSQNRLNVVPGFLLIALAGAMWGIDGLLRVPLLADTPVSVIVLAEHAILVLATIPFLRGALPVLRRLSGPDWLALIVVGAGASAVATALFTQSFSYGEINATLLLQKLQPAIVLLAAWWILKERPLRRYWAFFLPAVGGAWLMTFRDPFDVSVTEVKPALFALGAAVLWGLGTVLGRRLIPQIEFKQLTALRFLVGLPAAAIVVTVLSDWGGVGRLRGDDFLDVATMPNGVSLPGGLLLVAAIPGLLALLSYYRGLRTTPAISATLAELAFPLTALLVNAYFQLNFQTPDNSQWFGAFVLAAAITAMTIVSLAKRPAAVGVQVEAPALVSEPA